MPRLFPSSAYLFSLLTVLTLATSVSLSQGSEEFNVDDLRDLSIEELLNIEVTSVTLKEARQIDSPAAISVLSHDDIQRSGATSLADALRLVPGLHVASVNSSQHSISARGFSSVFSNKMLVLVDGRAVYSPLFAGVFWDLQQQMLDDLDRVEVIRGPGGAIWGANAMNGVINVVSQSADKTQGLHSYLGGGNVHQTLAGVRYGGTIGEDLYYRVFASYNRTDDFLTATGAAAGDEWQSMQGGFRFDYLPSSDIQATWQGDATFLDLYGGASSAYNANTLARWKKTFSERSNFEVQTYYDRTARDEMQRASSVTDTFDIRFKHQFGLGESHSITWGGGYRWAHSTLAQISPRLAVRRDELNLNLFSFFVQDEWEVVPKLLTLVGGAKVEHNDYTGIEVQPSLRAVSKPGKGQTLWASVSRAVRTPSAVEGQGIFGIPNGSPFAAPGGPYVPTVVGTADPGAEVLWAYELGYRVQPQKQLSFDLAAFYNRYTDLSGIGGFSRFIPGVPVGTAEMPFQNLMSAETYGGELSMTAVPTKRWRLTTNYSLIFANFHGPLASNPEGLERNIPTTQVSIRSSHDITDKLSVDVQLRYVDQIDTVRAYLTADVRLLYRVNDRLDLSIVGQNLLQDQHLEQAQQLFTQTTAVPRGVYGKVTWRF